MSSDPSNSTLPPSLNVLDYGAVPNSASDQTAAVQAALDALPTGIGGTVVVPLGVKFSMQSLAFPQFCYLRYFQNSDTTNGGPYGSFNENELVLWAANSGGTGLNEGAVNENKFVAAYHPGHVVQLRKDVTGQDAWFAPGQSRLDPARASYNIEDQGEITLLRFLSQRYCTTYNVTSGKFIQGDYVTYTCTTTWSPGTPSALDFVSSPTGQGFIKSAGATTVIYWIGGTFTNGQTLTSGANTAAAATIGNPVTHTFISISQNFETGGWIIGEQPGYAATALGVAGNVSITRSVSGGGDGPETVLNPGIMFADGLRGGNYGFWVKLDTSGGSTVARLYKMDLASGASDAVVKQYVVGGLLCAGVFDNSLSVEAGGHNISSITSGATGKYTVTLSVAAAHANYIVSCMGTDIADRTQIVQSRGTSSFQIWNYDSTGTLANLVGSVHVSVQLGDSA